MLKRQKDLELDSTNACLEGRKRGFALALRTYLPKIDPSHQIANKNEKLEISLWRNLFVKYSKDPKVNAKVQFPTLPSPARPT